MTTFMRRTMLTGAAAAGAATPAPALTPHARAAAPLAGQRACRLVSI